MVASAQKYFGPNLNILSKPIDVTGSPGIKENCIAEKRRWIEDNFPGIFQKLLFDDDKSRYAAPDVLLIDDRRQNTVPFEKSGGHAILFDGDVSQVVRRFAEISEGLTTEAALREFVSHTIRIFRHK
jgi:5'(3')-deoxyribonucleotidase